MERNDENSRNLTPCIDFLIDDIRNVVVVVVVVVAVVVVVIVILLKIFQYIKKVRYVLNTTKNCAVEI